MSRKKTCSSQYRYLFQTLVCDKNIGIVEQVHVIQTYGIMILRSQRHRGDGGKLIVMRLNDLEEFMTSLIAWDQKVDSLLNEGTSLDETMVTKNNRINSEFNQKRPSWDPKTKQDVRQDIIGKREFDRLSLLLW